MDEARRLGAIGYLMKPYVGQRLLNILAQVGGGQHLDESVDIAEVHDATLTFALLAAEWCGVAG